LRVVVLAAILAVTLLPTVMPPTIARALSTGFAPLTAITSGYIGWLYNQPTGGACGHTGIDLLATSNAAVLETAGPEVRLPYAGSIVYFVHGSGLKYTTANGSDVIGLVFKHVDPVAGGSIYSYWWHLGLRAKSSAGAISLAQSLVPQSLAYGVTYPAGTVLGKQGNIMSTGSGYKETATHVHMTLSKVATGDKCPTAGSPVDPSPYVGVDVNYDHAATRPAYGTELSKLYPTPPPPAPTCTGTQYLTRYWNNKTLSGTPTVTMCENGPINHEWGTGSPSGIPADNFSARWTRTANFTAGTYTITARADDGIRVWLDGNLVIDAWKDQGPTTYTATRSISAGDHPIKVEYYENGGGAVAQVTWTQGTTVTPPPATSYGDVVVDDQSGGFARAGTTSYWHESTGGYNNHFWWTYTNTSGVDNRATWTPNLPATGRWEVFVFIPSINATTTNARYRVDHQGVQTVVSINQDNYYNAWVSLGTHAFDSGSGGRVFMGDETYEGSSRQIAFDAVKWVWRGN
jgi:hypothetical protein